MILTMGPSYYTEFRRKSQGKMAEILPFVFPWRTTFCICSSCGEIPASAPKGLKDIGVRQWVCSNCEAVHDRDVEAARNIL